MTAVDRISIPVRFSRSATALLLATTLLAPVPARALSEIQREDVPVSDDDQGGSGEIERRQIPPPADVESAEPPDAEEASPQEEEEQEEVAPRTSPGLVPLPDPVVIPRDTGSQQGPAEEQEEPVPEILYDIDSLPEPVRRIRSLIMEACLSGDIERLRPLITPGDDGTQLSFGDIAGDPVTFLKELSGDDEGQEILAILYEVLAAGFVRLDEGQPGEMYVWPYFFAVPLEKLDKRQRVELFKIVTAGDYEDMQNYGAYIFYRVGISPEGKWLFFVAGD